MFCFLDKLLTVAPCEASNSILLFVLICCPHPPCWPNPANGWVIGPLWASASSLSEVCPHPHVSLAEIKSWWSPASTVNNVALLPWTYTWCSCGDSWLCKRALRRRSSAESHIPGTQIWQREGETTRWAKTCRVTIVVQKKKWSAREKPIQVTGELFCAFSGKHYL